MESILIIHRSKVVRATLKRHLESNFETLEAADSESGWQLLVLNHGIVTVISGLDVSQPNDAWATSTRISGIDTQLSGIELLDRVRYSNLSRLKNLPFYLIGSETHISDIAEEAQQHKVTGFLHNGMTREEILAALHLQAEKEAADPGGEAKPLLQEPMAVGESPMLLFPTQSLREPTQLQEGVTLQSLHKVDLLSPTLFRENMGRIFERPGTQAAVLVFSIAQLESARAQLGRKALEKIVERSAKLVQAKLKSGDSMGYITSGVFAVVTPIAQLAKCAAFSTKIVHSLSAAKVAVQGKPVEFSWCAGMSSSVEDGIEGAALLDLALSRLLQAMTAGGCRVYPEG